MIIAVGNDHHGLIQKEIVKAQFSLPHEVVEWNDVGSFTPERVDYPDYAIEVARAVQKKEAECGILFCGTGVGMSIAANRFKGIYAAIVWTSELAKKSKEDDNSNILVFPSDYINNSEIIPMINAWINAKFKGGRYAKRLDMIDRLGGVL